MPRTTSPAIGSVAQRSDRRRGAPVTERPRPLVLYLLTAEISSVLVRGQFDWLTSEGFDVHVGANLGDGDQGGPSVHQWDASAELHHVPFTRRVSPILDLKALFATYRLMRRVHPDIVNASTPKAGLLGMLAARACGVPVRVYVQRGLRFETTSGLTRRVLISLERLTEWCATTVLVNSPSAASVAIEAGLGRSRDAEMIGSGSSNGVDIEHYVPASPAQHLSARSSLGVPSDAIVIGFIGRLTRDKGISDTLESFDHLRAERPDLHLLLVGDHEPGDPVSDDVRRRLTDRSDVTQVSWVPDTAAVFPAIDVLVFASAREGLPNVPLQAQAAGVPVVAYQATGTVDAVEHGVGGLLVALGDQASLTETVGKVVDDAVLRATLGAAGPEWVRHRFEQTGFWKQLADDYRTWMDR